MTYPGKPTQLSGKLVITDEVHEPTQANVVREGETIVGLYLDDTTPNLTRVWLPKAVDFSMQYGGRLLVAVATGQMGMHYQPSIARGGPIENMFEAYVWGFDEPWEEMPWPARGEYQHVIIQRDWRGPHGHLPPSPECASKTLARASRCVNADPDRIWLF